MSSAGCEGGEAGSEGASSRATKRLRQRMASFMVLPSARRRSMWLRVRRSGGAERGRRLLPRPPASEAPPSKPAATWTASAPRSKTRPAKTATSGRSAVNWCRTAGWMNRGVAGWTRLRLCPGAPAGHDCPYRPQLDRRLARPPAGPTERKSTDDPPACWTPPTSTE